MVRRPKTDARQADFFGAPASKRAASDQGSRWNDKPVQKARPPLPPQETDRLEIDNLDTLATRLSPADLNDLVAAMPDNALAHLVIVTVRQLRRRLVRHIQHPKEHRVSSPLERAARQLIAEWREDKGDDDL